MTNDGESIAGRTIFMTVVSILAPPAAYMTENSAIKPSVSIVVKIPRERVYTGSFTTYEVPVILIGGRIKLVVIEISL
jgi:hypothetical protein